MKTYTTGEVASFCGINFRTVIRWIERGILKAHKLPGRGDHRIAERDLIEFLSTNDLPLPPILDNANRVLIVDDEPPMVRAIDRVLSRLGFDTRSAADGFHAGTQLVDFAPGLMTLDLQMPGLGGLNVLNLIRADTRYRDLKVLVISGLPSPALRKARDEGADAVLPKPFTESELADVIKQLVNLPH